MTPKTLEDMVALNRTAEKIVQMGVAPPGREAYALAEQLLGVIHETQAEIRARFPQHVGDAMAGNVCHLMRVHTMQPIVDAAKAVVRIVDEGRPIADIRGDEVLKLIAAVHNHNLIHEMPTPNPELDP